jgi:hypothetical protein
MRKVGVKPIRTPMNEHSTPEDLVRQHTCPAINQKIDDELAARVRLYSKAGRDALSRRIEELEHEWDVERLLEANASSLILTGTLLGAAGCRRVPPGAAGGCWSPRWCPASCFIMLCAAGAHRYPSSDASACGRGRRSKGSAMPSRQPAATSMTMCGMNPGIPGS